MTVCKKHMHIHGYMQLYKYFVIYIDCSRLDCTTVKGLRQTLKFESILYVIECNFTMQEYKNYSVIFIDSKYFVQLSFLII